MKSISLIFTISLSVSLFSSHLFANINTDISKNISQLNVKQPIIAYFGYGSTYCGCSANNDTLGYSLTPIEDGYYRILLERNTEGHYLVKDFDQSSHKPVSSAFWIVDPKHLFLYESRIAEGPLKLFRKDGSLLLDAVIHKHVETSGNLFYKNNIKAISSKLLQNNQYQFTVWYESGKKAAEYTTDESNNIIKGKAWTNDNKQTNDLDEIIKIVEILLTKVYAFE